MSKVGIFGGSFNPPHIGHLRLALSAAKELSLDKVLIIPALKPPHKVNPALASPSDRLRMCELTFTDKVFEVSDMELHREGKSYTIDTIRAIRRQNPDDKLFLIVGADMLLSFHTWKDYKDILSLCTLVAAVREGDGSEELAAYKDKMLTGFDVRILEFTPIPISSSEIRESIKETGTSEFITLEVKEYIESRMLYK